MRIKIKHLLIVVVALSMSFLTIQALVIPIWKEKQVEAAFQAGDPEAFEMMKALIDQSWTISRKLTLIERYILEPELGQRYDVYVTPTSSSWSDRGFSRGFKTEDVQSYIDEYIERGSADRIYFDYAQALKAKTIATEKSKEEAIAYIEEQKQVILSKREFVDEELLLLQPEYLRQLGKKEEALEFLEAYRAQEEKRLQHAFVYVPSEKWIVLKVKLLLEENLLSEALSAIKEWEQQRKKAATMEEDWYADESERVSQLKKQLQQMKGDIEFRTVTGYVKKEDGTPVVGAAVVMRDEEESYRSISPIGEENETKTDEQGKFTLTVLPGDYQIGIRLFFEQIDGYSWPVDQEEILRVTDQDIQYDIELRRLMNVTSPVNSEVIEGETITFQWEETDAAYYQVYTAYHFENGSMSSLVSGPITDDKWSVAITELYHSPFFVDYEISNQDVYEGGLDPAQLFDYLHPKGLFSWSVVAYDENDKELRRSNGYRLDESLTEKLPFFTVRNRSITEADQLLLDGKHQQALDAYRSLIKENNDDDLALRMAVKVLNIVRQQTKDNSPLLREEMYHYIAKLSELTEKPFYAEMMMEKAEKEGDDEAFREWMEMYEQHGGDEN
ncbi:carboxypeptidase-like regulatory domain-containing protein [Halalkalibacter krulwichiae]|uniref:Carboxypeptidase regulatory-like domain-containing protein n=1 Tax=Halalkalibacter krulwichiae TaxID=199441 RepID=A0A1X9MDT1_9BACI|nr:carboxypeptidase-like regulatory domain-containing protein [Halalkalibacter krulwichiae]ARK31609.1 hypothetical protein BkAM31D_18130 [Halalkalibacter krulwichiae]